MNSFFNKLILGLAMIAIGVLYLLDQLELLTFDLGYMLSTYWPVFIIFFGLKGLLIPRNGRGGSFVWSVFVIFLGGYFLLNNLGIDSFNYDNMYKFIVPVLLILFGLNILFKGSSSSKVREGLKDEWRKERELRRQDHREMKKQLRDRNRMLKEQDLADYPTPPPIPPIDDLPEFPPTEPPKWKDETFRAEKQQFTNEAYKKADHDWKWTHFNQHKTQDKVDRSSFIGDVYFGQDDWVLSPLNISLFIGDTVIDLTKASIPDGETNIQVSSFIGDLKIFIPNDMQLEVSVTASAFISDMKVLDRYESGLFKNLHAQTRDYVDGDKKIRITVSTFIGDVIVKRVG